MDTRAGQDQQALGVVTEQLRDMQQTKANHAELMRLVEKLNHRPKPGQPVGVQQLLAVPYPMPPGATITSPRSNRSRPVSALGDVRLGHGHPAHLREVPTALPTSPADPSDPSQIPRPFLATSEQILVRSHPADAAPPSEPHPPSRPSTTSGGGRPPGRALVPPSSHTSSLSARASATAERILQTKCAHGRRPFSNRSRAHRTARTALHAHRTARTPRTHRTHRTHRTPRTAPRRPLPAPSRSAMKRCVFARACVRIADGQRRRAGGAARRSRSSPTARTALSARCILRGTAARLAIR